MLFWLIFLFLLFFLPWLFLRVYVWWNNKYPVPFHDGYEECVLITGCDSGIGRNTAIQLVKEGFTVFGTCYSDNSFEGLEKECVGKGVLVPFQVDITNEDSVKALSDLVEKELTYGNNRRLISIVNNAGVLTNGPLEMQPMRSIIHQFDVNVFGQIRILQEFTKHIRINGGRIVNVVSVAGRVTTGALGAYSASKHAMEAVTDALREELHPWNVSVSAIEPGIINTPLARSASEHDRIWDNCYFGAAKEYSVLYETSRFSGMMGLKGQPVRIVTEAIVHALTSPFPRTRYLVGQDAHLLAFLKWSCCDRIFDAWARFSTKLAKKTLQQQK